MVPIEFFRERLDQLQREQPNAAACRELIRDICAYPWEDVEERDAAQQLVNRLERLHRMAKYRY